MRNERQANRSNRSHLHVVACARRLNRFCARVDRVNGRNGVAARKEGSSSVTEIMAQSIQASDIGPDVLYWLGSNPKEAERISRLNPILQAKEIGKVEASLMSNPPVRKTSTAPAPIAPVTPRASGTPAYDTTDPRSTKSMSTSEWIEAERMRQIKKYEAQRNR